MCVQQGVKEWEGPPVVGVDAQQGEGGVTGGPNEKVGARGQQQQDVVGGENGFALEAQRSVAGRVVDWG